MKFTKYNRILVDKIAKEKYNLSLPHSKKKLVIVNIPSEESELLDFFRDRANDNQLLITSRKEVLPSAHYFGLDTCFINDGTNDVVDYPSTYEIYPEAKMLKK